MPLREHLRELRTRLVKAGLAIIAGAVVGWFCYDWVFAQLLLPLTQVSKQYHLPATINFNNIMEPFNMKLRMSVYLGLVFASPIWLYQVWAFIVPGLTKRERRYAIGFVVAGVPLLFGGIYLAWLTLPNAVSFFGSQAPPGASLFQTADEYLTFVTRLMLAFAIAMLLPLLLVALNMAGVLSHERMAKAWRVAVFLIFLFAAVASPTPDAGSMILLALPMVALYVIAVGIAWWIDRRRSAREAASPFADLSDDEASEL